MPNIINAITTGVGGLSTTADASGAITFQSNGTNTATISTGGNLAAVGSVSGASLSTPGNISSPTGTMTIATINASGNISTPTGTITASSFVGNGASLTGIVSGQIQTELFTAPGTWNRPSTVTQVRVTVVGGGGPAWPGVASGGTSSFGPAVSATGGSSLTGPGAAGSPGSGSVAVGTALKTGNMGVPTVAPASIVAFGNITGLSVSPLNPSASGIAYSTSLASIAGAATVNTPGTRSGAGGVAIAVVPVSNPVAVTVGAGGSGGPTHGGIGGAVLVEFVG